MILQSLLTLVVSTTVSGDMSDSWVTTKARLAVMTTSKIDSRNVHVDTTNGVVTVYGKVANEEEKKAVERSLAGLDGVAKIDNRLQIVPADKAEITKAQDDQIKKEAETALATTTVLKEDSVKVLSVDKGVVTIGGEAKTLSNLAYACNVVAHVDGVRQIDNRVKVNDDRPGSDTQTTMKDAWTTTQVKVALVGNAAVPAMAVHVDTFNGAVILFGTVDSEIAKEEAGKEAKKINGVTRVNNELTIDTKMAKSAKLKDKDVEKNVKSALSKERIEELQVAVSDGVVRLGGKVESEAKKAKVAIMSRAAKGARAVKNEIEVISEDLKK